MKTLLDVKPTPEQLPIISNPQAGVTLIRGAAGSGKTTTALLMLKQLSEFWLRHRERTRSIEPVRILVIAFNRTLRGYISHLAEQQLRSNVRIHLDVTTFGKWAKDLTESDNIYEDYLKSRKIVSLGRNLQLPDDFLLDEVEYCLGRFLHENRDDYYSTRRLGRGIAPRMERLMRARLIDEVITPYELYKERNGLIDWNDLAIELISNPRALKYDVVIADETQDLSANQMRAVMKHAADSSTIVFVLDAAQRIYPRGWNWREISIKINPNRSFRLRDNHRNTIEICYFAKPLLEGLDLTDDGTMPDLDSCKRHGPKPQVIRGRYSAQCSYAISHIQRSIDLEKESVAFAHPKAGGWFDYLRGELSRAGLKFVELSRKSEWPRGTENIALISMPSIKGLEFDHVFIIGLNKETTPHGNEEGDTAFENLRRMLAMAITRSRCTVIIGCKPDEASSLIEWLHPDTYEDVSL